MKKSAILFAAIFFTFAGCASLQKDIFISAEDASNSEKIQEIENQVITLDGSFYLNEKKLSKDEIASAEFIKREIDAELNQPHIDKVVESRLLSLKGRCTLMQGKKSEAAKCFKAAKSKYENDVQFMILSRRLGLISDISEIRMKLDSEALVIEDALEHLEKGEYDICAGLFDSVFVNSNSIYKEPYAALRQKAWNLKNVNSEYFFVDWNSNTITVIQMMTMANSKANLIDYYTGGKKYDGKKLYQILIKSGAMKSTTGEQGGQISEKTAVTKIISARFLWNLYSSKNSINPSKFSEKYRNRKIQKSPVADIELNNPDFDAVLGTVENEIMSLADGENFHPDVLMSPSEFDACLNKIK